ncbi:MAG: hypothetical protein A2Z72_07800 [Omnitrophica bacterium RBG_13_46_9]|nr:MAG: hypothetical protein A2Z72_07800 [Omnitrophica bacterium RBG_13_46_9]
MVIRTVRGMVSDRRESRALPRGAAEPQHKSFSTPGHPAATYQHTTQNIILRIKGVKYLGMVPRFRMKGRNHLIMIPVDISGIIKAIG